jgi:hypothetical protein
MQKKQRNREIKLWRLQLKPQLDLPRAESRGLLGDTILLEAKIGRSSPLTRCRSARKGRSGRRLPNRRSVPTAFGISKSGIKGWHVVARWVRNLET